MQVYVNLLYGEELKKILAGIFSPTTTSLEMPRRISPDFERDFTKLVLDILGEKEVIKIIKRGIRTLGRNIWEAHYKNGGIVTCADHVMSSPAALAFALAEGEFSPREIKKIKFNRWETSRTYVMKYYDWEYPWKILRGVLEWQPPPLEATEEHCCCTSCCC